MAIFPGESDPDPPDKLRYCYRRYKAHASRSFLGFRPFCQKPVIYIEVLRPETDDNHLFKTGINSQKTSDLPERDPGSLKFGITIYSGTDTGESDGFQPVLYCQPQTVTITGG